jgi:putative NADH-flavin reductase
MKIVVYGASGKIGQRIVAEALGRGHDVVAAVRDPARVTTTSDRLTVVQTDPTDEYLVTRMGTRTHAVISALNGDAAFFKKASHALVDGLRPLTGGARLIWVGGASSLLLPDGRRLIDAGRIPAEWIPLVTPQIEVLDYFRTFDDLPWTYISPAETIEPGPRQPGGFRLGDDHLVADENGLSRITYDDFAAAIIDEVETPAHLNARFTVGY